MTFQYFFTRFSSLPPGVGISAWGPVHIGWLLAIGLTCLLCCRHYRSLCDDGRQRFLKRLALFLLAQEMVKNLYQLALGTLSVDHLPLHLCGISLFVCAASAFTPARLPRQMLYSLVLPGAVAALVFPNWMAYPALHFSSFHSFSIHGNLVLFALLPLTAGQLRPDWRRLPRIFALLALLGAAVYPLNKLWGTNFLFISTPSPGSPLMPLSALFGNPGYIFGLAGLIVLLWVPMYAPWAMSARRRVAASRQS